MGWFPLGLGLVMEDRPSYILSFHAVLLSIAERVTTEPKTTLSAIGKHLLSGTDQCFLH